MAKKLRIEAEIPLPEDHFEAAEAVGKMREPIKHLAEAVEAAGGKVTHSVVAERASPKKKAEPAPEREPELPRMVPRQHGYAAE